MRIGERDFHEMRVFEVAVTGDIVNNGNFSGSFWFWFGPNFGSFWTGFSGGGCSSSETRRHFCCLKKCGLRRTERGRKRCTEAA